MQHSPFIRTSTPMGSDSDLSSPLSPVNPFEKGLEAEQSQENNHQPGAVKPASMTSGYSARGIKEKSSDSLIIENLRDVEPSQSKPSDIKVKVIKKSSVAAARITKSVPPPTRKSSRITGAKTFTGPGTITESVTVVESSSVTQPVTVDDLENVSAQTLGEKYEKPKRVASSRKPRATERPSWGDPKSADWDVVRFLKDDSMQSPDWMTEPVNPKHEYIYESKKGSGRYSLTEPTKYNFGQPMPPTTHPDLRRHEKRGTDNVINRAYYSGMPHDLNLPLAGKIDGEVYEPEFVSEAAGSKTRGASKRAAVSTEGPSTSEGVPATKVRRIIQKSTSSEAPLDSSTSSATATSTTASGPPSATPSVTDAVSAIASALPTALRRSMRGGKATEKAAAAIATKSTKRKRSTEKSSASEPEPDSTSFTQNTAPLSSDESTNEAKEQARESAPSSEENGDGKATAQVPEIQILTRDTFKEESFHAKPSIKIHVPDHIKGFLVDDWENVTKNQQLVPIPAKHSVTSILNDYLEYEKPHRVPGSAPADILEEVVSGLKVYFERCLGRILLYRFERNQYVEALEAWNSTKGELAGKTAADTYGAEHLARLIVTLPELIAQTNMDQPSVNRLRSELTSFTTWLGRNATTYFVSEYETPSQDYVEKARGVY